MSSLMLPRSYLYVPGDRADRLAKAHTRGADAIIADLEDAVAPSAKDSARENVESWLQQPQPHDAPALWVRLNGGQQGIEEMRVLSRFPALTGVLVPKAESPEYVGEVRAACAAVHTRTLLSPMIESAAGLVHAVKLASAPGVHQLHMGEVDLAADLGMSPGNDDAELGYARARVVVVSRYAGLLPPVAPVNARFEDPKAYEHGTRALARLGFIGRDCIHPAQVAVANDVFTPDADEIAWARRVLHQSKSESGTFRGPDGSMIDEAVLRRARLLLERVD